MIKFDYIGTLAWHELKKKRLSNDYLCFDKIKRKFHKSVKF